MLDFIMNYLHAAVLFLGCVATLAMGKAWLERRRYRNRRRRILYVFPPLSRRD